MDDRPVIGWRERIVLPKWGIRGLRAKIDTGADTSAIHVEDLEVIDDVARFHVAMRRDATRLSHLIEAPIVRSVSVRSSSGHPDQRVVVETRVRIGGLRLDAQFTLVRRHRMKYRVLIGRRLIANAGFVVDVTHDGLAPFKKRPAIDPEETP
ncbi:MAG: RimK/LysX family protein [Planctomycetota bacterium]